MKEHAADLAGIFNAAKIRNSKHETRNKCEIQMIKIRNRADRKWICICF
jgi:hypothetical protein